MTVSGDLHPGAPGLVSETALATASGVEAVASPPWYRRPEIGSILGIRALVLVCRVFGRRGARLLLVPIVFYYACFAGTARAAIRDYYRRLGLHVGPLAVFRHLLRFAQCALDRVYFVRGDRRPFHIACHGREHLEALRDTKRGAILLGAHLGSFEAMRFMATEEDLPIHVVVDFRNARRVSAVLGALSPSFRERLICIDPSDPSFIFDLRDRIERGELVAILADRIGPDTRSARTTFLGASAAFPTGPFWLAAMLRCPVYATFGLHRAPATYDLYCEPLTQTVALPRGRREEILRDALEAWAATLERYCRLCPDNWFNFYDFWAPDPPAGRETP